MNPRPKIAFLGLGTMGGPMAGHLLAAGFPLAAFNRSAPRAQEWLRRFGGLGEARLAASPEEAAADADILVSCVGRDEDLEEVMLGPQGALDALPSGALVIDHTTVSARLARRVAEEAQHRSLLFLDAPVSGGQAGAEKGALSIMCGGTAQAMEAARATLAIYGARIVHVGPAGAGQTAKMANQMCIAGVLSGLSEAVRFAQAAGLDLDRLLEALSGGAAQSWQMENRWHSMTQDQFDFGFAIDWMRKDLGYALEEARALGVSAPVTALVDQFYADVQQMGGGRQDTSALVRRLPRGTR